MSKTAEDHLREAFGDRANQVNQNVAFVDEYHFGQYPDSVQRTAIYNAMKAYAESAVREYRERQWIPVSQLDEYELSKGEWMAYNAYNQGAGYGRIYKHGISHACDLGESSMYNITHVRRIDPPLPPNKEA